jgi:serine/threonine protein kinase
MKARFDREAQTIARLNHPHICVLHDVGHQDGTDYLVMEYLDGFEFNMSTKLSGRSGCSG